MEMHSMTFPHEYEQFFYFTSALIGASLPHEIRAVSTSISAFNHASVEDILEAGIWSHYSTFVDNYLRNVWPKDSDEGTFTKIPLFIATGKRISDS